MPDSNAQQGQKLTGRGSRQFHGLPPFVPLMKDLLLDTSLSSDAKVMHALVQELSWRDNGDPYDETENGIAMPQLAALAGLSEPTARKAIKQLVSAGWLTSWKRGQGLANAYQALTKPHIQDERILGGTPKESSGLAGASKEVDPDEVLDTSVASAPDVARSRKRDVVFDALAESTGCDPQLEGGRIAKAATALRKHDDYVLAKGESGRDEAERLLADAVRRTAVRYRRVFAPEIALTPQALVNNWRRVWELPERPLTPEEIASGEWRNT